jgi:hypothetical protein
VGAAGSPSGDTIDGGRATPVRILLHQQVDIRPIQRAHGADQAGGGHRCGVAERDAQRGEVVPRGGGVHGEIGGGLGERSVGDGPGGVVPDQQHVGGAERVDPVGDGGVVLGHREQRGAERDGGGGGGRQIDGVRAGEHDHRGRGEERVGGGQGR